MTTSKRFFLARSRFKNESVTLGAEIGRDYTDKEPHLVTILKGSIPFIADLMRAIPIPMTLDVLGVSSYAGTQSSGEVRLTKDLDDAIEGRHVLVVEDIIDTGLTLSYVLRNLRQRMPASVKVVTLLDKPSGTEAHKSRQIMSASQFPAALWSAMDLTGANVIVISRM